MNVWQLGIVSEFGKTARSRTNHTMTDINFVITTGEPIFVINLAYSAVHRKS